MTADEMDGELKKAMDTDWKTDVVEAKALVSVLIRHNQYWRSAAAYWHGVNCGRDNLAVNLRSEIEYLRKQDRNP